MEPLTAHAASGLGLFLLTLTYPPFEGIFKCLTFYLLTISLGSSRKEGTEIERKEGGLPCPSCFPLSPIRMPLFHPLRLLSPRTSGIFSVPDLVLCGRAVPNYMALWDKLEKKWAPWCGCSPWESAWLGKQARLQQPTPFNWIIIIIFAQCTTWTIIHGSLDCWPPHFPSYSGHA